MKNVNSRVGTFVRVKVYARLATVPNHVVTDAWWSLELPRVTTAIPGITWQTWVNDLKGENLRYK